jgi:hypothetical protein
VTVQSSPGRGSAFTVHLPADRPTGPEGMTKATVTTAAPVSPEG